MPFFDTDSMIDDLKDYLKVKSYEDKIDLLQKRIAKNRELLNKFEHHFIVYPKSSKDIFLDAIAADRANIEFYENQIDTILEKKKAKRSVDEKTDSFFMGAFLGYLLGTGVLATLVYFLT